jgi:hypothetical protein
LIQAQLDSCPQLKDDPKFTGLYGRLHHGQKRMHASMIDENIAPAASESLQIEHPAIRRQLNDRSTGLPVSSSSTTPHYVPALSMSDPPLAVHSGIQVAHTLLPHGHLHHPFSPQHNLHHAPSTTHYHTVPHYSLHNYHIPAQATPYDSH